VCDPGAVQHDLPTEDVRIASKVSPPRTVAEHDDRCGAYHIIITDDGAAKGWSCTEECEVSARDQRATQLENAAVVSHGDFQRASERKELHALE